MKNLDELLYSKFFISSEIKEIDKYTIENEPIASVDLMERAAKAICNSLTQIYSNDYRVKVFAGPGNNGGDAIAVARLLHLKSYNVELFVVKISDKLSPDAEINLKRLEEIEDVTINYIADMSSMPEFTTRDVIVEGLFGTGLSRPIVGLCAEVIKEINKSEVNVVSIDIPSGLMAEDNSSNDLESIIKADYTISLEFPKLSFLFPENEKYVGKIIVTPIGLHPDIVNCKPTNYNILLRKDLRNKVKELSRFTHKGTMGHSLLISGSFGKMGAAILSSQACLRTGIGLLTVHIPERGYNIIQTSVPEAMVDIDSSETIYTDTIDTGRYEAIGIGPGIGTDDRTYKALKTLLQDYQDPMVFDADAVNLISEHEDLKSLIPEGSILTPHPGEFARLVGSSENSYERLNKQISFAKKYSVVLVVKGAFTTIVTPTGDCYFNTTGNPGMATAGSGDVLTGVILALLSQGYSSRDAAMLGVYLHGLSGDIAACNKGERSLIASDIVDFMGDSWKKLLKLS
jgi:NAD(P)H-hydrate epimerase